MSNKQRPKTQTYFATDEVKDLLIKKAISACGNTRGALGRYITKIATTELLFLDDNIFLDDNSEGLSN